MGENQLEEQGGCTDQWSFCSPAGELAESAIARGLFEIFFFSLLLFNDLPLFIQR